MNNYHKINRDNPPPTYPAPGKVACVALQNYLPYNFAVSSYNREYTGSTTKACHYTQQLIRSTTACLLGAHHTGEFCSTGIRWTWYPSTAGL
jgi:hypothetical protein